ncbi:DNA starvation/stationary phase protection protein [Candidatus Gracilibacteria bacterium]|nr:DNA starvation/stationary phase protection protein [Candidatus Gracilibacteria bacterium]
MNKSQTNSLVPTLNTLVATLFHSYVLYKGYHWNFRGESFYQYHLLLDNHAEKIYKSIDEVAERIRQLDGVAEGTFSQYPKLSVLKVVETNDVHQKDLPKLLTTLVSVHETNIDLLNQLIAEATEQVDVGTADLLTSFLEDHQQMRWFIKASQG